MLTGDIGRAALARDDALDTARLALFHPLTSMLASPVAEAEALSRMAPPVWVEDKYDGIRAQLHKQGAEVRLYSRELRDISEQFPEVVKAASGQPWDGVLDGEVLGWRDGRRWSSRSSRRSAQGTLGEVQADVPVIYVAFDALALADDASVRPSRCCGCRSATGEPVWNAEPRPCRGLRSCRPDHGRGCRGARVRVRISAGPRQQGLMIKDPDRATRRVGEDTPAQAQEGADHARLRRGRRRGRARQATRRPVRLHLRGDRRSSPAQMADWSPSARRTAA